MFDLIRLRGLAESGLVEYSIKRSTPKNEICKVENRKTFSHDDEQRKVLSLYDLSGPFILLVAGSSLSLLVFLIEKIYNFLKPITYLSVPPPMNDHEMCPSLDNTAHNIEIIDQLSLNVGKHESSLDEATDKLENIPATGGTNSVKRKLNVEEL